MKVKSLLVLLALAGCGKVAEVNSAIKDITDVEDCDVVCPIDVAADATSAVDIAQSISDSEDSATKKN